MSALGLSHYLAEVIDAVMPAGFKKGAPMIGLTEPPLGVAYGLSADIIGQLWILDGYPGNGAFAVKALKKISCHNLAPAWLSDEPTGLEKYRQRFFRVLARI